MKIAICFGTRPEAIKLAPVIRELRSRDIRTDVILSGQHADTKVREILEWFEIGCYDYIMAIQADQTMEGFIGSCLQNYVELFVRANYNLVIVEGDTNTALAASLAAFYNKIPVAHVEAGLRTDDRYEPFPEEMNRRLISQIAEWHFSPSEKAEDVLSDEGLLVRSNGRMVGNTVIDALVWTMNKLDTCPCHLFDSSKYVLITLHRRESFGKSLEKILEAINGLAENFPRIEFIFPVHPNPAVRSQVNRGLRKERVIEPGYSGHFSLVDNPTKKPNIKLLDPLTYQEMVSYLQNAHMVITDSGGIQEEAGFLGIPTFVCRNKTERPEVVETGVARLIGNSDPQRILANISIALINKAHYKDMSKRCYAYGKGDASKKIADVLERELNEMR